MSFVASFATAAANRNAEYGNPFNAAELDALLAVWKHYTFDDADADVELAIDVVADTVGDDWCEVGCIVLEWA